MGCVACVSDDGLVQTVETLVKLVANVVGYVSIVAIVGDGQQPPADGMLVALTCVLGLLASLLLAAVGDR